jgi:ABC-type glycerol-3-phosphate transport system permease component
VEFQGQQQFGVNIPLVLTVVVLSALPLIIFYILQRRNFIQGLTGGHSARCSQVR